MNGRKAATVGGIPVEVWVVGEGEIGLTGLGEAIVWGLGVNAGMENCVAPKHVELTPKPELRFFVETVDDVGRQVGWVRDRHEDDYPVFRGESVSQAEAVCDALNADHEADPA